MDSNEDRISPTGSMGVSPEQHLDRRRLLQGIAASSLAAGLVAAENMSVDALPLEQVPNLTGTWSGNEGGVYYIRSVGNLVYWVGMSFDDDGATFTNVFRGTIAAGDNIIVGDWADVPRGNTDNAGTMSLNIVSNTDLQRRTVTGGFSGSEWTR